MKAGYLHGLGRRIKDFVREDGGVSAIEFAIAAPIVLILVIATVELAAYMVLDATVQMAAQAAARAGLINVLPGDGQSREAMATAAAMKVLGDWGTAANTTVTVSEVNYGSYNNIGTKNSSAGAGGFGDVVSYNLTLTRTSSSLGIFGLNPLIFSRNFLVQNEQ